MTAVGKNEASLKCCPELGADHVIPLRQGEKDVRSAFTDEPGEYPLHMVPDYLWGQPAEWLFAALTRDGMLLSANEDCR